MVTIILFAPLLGAVLCGFGYRWLSEKGAMVTATSLLFLACLLSWIVFFTFDGVTVRPIRISAGSSRGRWRRTGATGWTG